MNIVTDPMPPGDVGKPAGRTRRISQRINANVRACMTNMRRVVARNGKAQLETDLGVDSADLDAAYNAMTTLALALDAGTAVPDIDAGPE